MLVGIRWLQRSLFGKEYFRGRISSFIGDIRSPIIVEGTYCPVNERLIQDINMKPNKSMDLFDIHTEKFQLSEGQ